MSVNRQSPGFPVIKPNLVFSRGKLRRACGLRTLSREFEARMDGQKPEAVEEQSRTENPEDVAVLYSWANLQGARYRDFQARGGVPGADAPPCGPRPRMRRAGRRQRRRPRPRLAERAAREAEEIARLHEKAARKAGRGQAPARSGDGRRCSGAGDAAGDGAEPEGGVGACAGCAECRGGCSGRSG